MNVSIAKIKANPHSGLDFSFSETPDPAAFGYADFTLDAPLTVSGRLTNLGGGSYAAVISWQGSISQVCSRCGQSFSREVSGETETMYSEHPADDAEGESEIWPVEGDCADIACAVLNEIWFHSPMQPLCREDCRGLCPICGADLNVQTCSCGEQSIDPRWEKLKDLKFQH